MMTLEAIRIAGRSLATNKLRTFLTMLGVVIGVASVVALLAIGRGAKLSIAGSIQSEGSNLVYILPNSDGSGRGPGLKSATGQAPSLTVDDAQALARLPGVAGVAPEFAGAARLVARDRTWQTRVTGVTTSYATLHHVKIATGDWIQAAQLSGRASVMVLGATAAERLFGQADAIGRTVRVSTDTGRGIDFRVIGVARARGGTLLGSPDDVAYVPMTTLQARLVTERSGAGAMVATAITVQTAENAIQEDVEKQIGSVLQARHRAAPEDFTIQSQRDILRVLDTVIGALTLLLGMIAGISLLVGGIGIMNILLVSVTERTREIGLRGALGARRSDILQQFIAESLAVCLLGGALGVAIGGGVAAVISHLPIPAGDSGSSATLPAAVGLDSVLLALGVSFAVGMAAGIYPALRAASLHPIQALRQE